MCFFLQGAKKENIKFGRISQSDSSDSECSGKY